jgi:hypothetical protein
MKGKFIPVEWKTDRNDGYVNIDLIDKQKEKEVLRAECCPKSIIGCNVTACGWNPGEKIRIQVYDKRHNLLAESNWEKEVNRIIIEKNPLGEILIIIE